MTNEFKDRVSLVTRAAPASDGRWPSAFAGAGAHVVVADVNLDHANETVAEIGDAAMAIEVDISNEAMVDALVRRAIETFGRIDVLCNNAGMADNLDEELFMRWPMASSNYFKWSFSCETK
jgi:NAD(P)-dependent dehydrogenase (short-subunit alcohol dehydrogenase family)